MINDRSDNYIINSCDNDWNLISSYHYLTEDFIIKYQNKVNWNWIARRQKLSLSFIKKHLDMLSDFYEDLLCNKNISEEIKQELKLYYDVLR